MLGLVCGDDMKPQILRDRTETTDDIYNDLGRQPFSER